MFTFYRRQKQENLECERDRPRRRKRNDREGEMIAIYLYKYELEHYCMALYCIEYTVFNARPGKYTQTHSNSIQFPICDRSREHKLTERKGEDFSQWTYRAREKRKKSVTLVNVQCVCLRVFALHIVCWLCARKNGRCTHPNITVNCKSGNSKIETIFFLLLLFYNKAAKEKRSRHRSLHQNWLTSMPS